MCTPVFVFGGLFCEKREIGNKPECVCADFRVFFLSVLMARGVSQENGLTSLRFWLEITVRLGKKCGHRKRHKKKEKEQGNKTKEEKLEVKRGLRAGVR